MGRYNDSEGNLIPQQRRPDPRMRQTKPIVPDRNTAQVPPDNGATPPPPKLDRSGRPEGSPNYMGGAPMWKQRLNGQLPPKPGQPQPALPNQPPQGGNPNIRNAAMPSGNPMTDQAQARLLNQDAKIGPNGQVFGRDPNTNQFSDPRMEQLQSQYGQRNNDPGFSDGMGNVRPGNSDPRIQQYLKVLMGMGGMGSLNGGGLQGGPSVSPMPPGGGSPPGQEFTPSPPGTKLPFNPYFQPGTPGGPPPIFNDGQGPQQGPQQIPYGPQMPTPPWMQGPQGPMGGPTGNGNPWGGNTIPFMPGMPPPGYNPFGGGMMPQGPQSVNGGGFMGPGNGQQDPWANIRNLPGMNPHGPPRTGNYGPNDPWGRSGQPLPPYGAIAM